MTRTLFALAASISLVACLASGAAAQEQQGEPVVLKVGDEAPEFESLDDAGEPWKSIDHVGKNILVLYFYPKDMTPGCTAQACSYRDALADLNEQGVEVIGVSGDTVESHDAFKKAEHLTFTLLSDPKGEISKAFGVKPLAIGDVVIASRWTFVIDLDGQIAYKDDKVDPTKDVANVKEVIAKLEKPAK